MDNIDIRLLTVFEAIYRLGSVTSAAEALDMGQPAVSVALSKLRHTFGDPLFVRTSNGMEATPFAEGLVRPVKIALEAVEAVLAHHNDFDPATSDRTLRICMTDISQLVLLPKLLERLRQVAPCIRVEVLPLSANTAQILQRGEADVAVGFMPQLDAGFYQQVMFHQTFVCVVGKRHPRITDHLTLEQYQAEDHAIVSSSGAAPLVVDREVARREIRRRVVLEIPNFLGAALVAERTDLIITIPSRLADLIGEHGAFRIFPVPFPLPQYAIKMHWHERYHHDEGNKWFRGIIYELLADRT